MEKLEFIDENGEKTQFYVIEETRINGINYLLVSESDNEDEEAEAYILKDSGRPGDFCLYFCGTFLPAAAVSDL